MNGLIVFLREKCDSMFGFFREGGDVDGGKVEDGIVEDDRLHLLLANRAFLLRVEDAHARTADITHLTSTRHSNEYRSHQYWSLPGCLQSPIAHTLISSAHRQQILELSSTSY